MQKRKVKKFLALLLAVSMIVPAQMTVFAEDCETTDAQQTTQEVQEVTDADKAEETEAEEPAKQEVETEAAKETEGAEVQAQVANDPVAKVGDTSYETFAEAVAAAKKSGEKVTLLADSTLSEELKVDAGENLALDLAGKTLTFTDPKDPVEVEGTLSIESSSKNGKLVMKKGSVSADGEAAKVTLKSGTIESTDTSASGYGVAAYNGATVVVNGGEIISQYAALSGNNTMGNMNFEVNGGTLTAKYGPAIYMPGQVKLTITGGVLNGGISLRMGQVDISGGTINAMTDAASTDSPAGYYNYSGNAWLPDALYVFAGTYNSEDATYGNSLKLNITGGTFNCTNGLGSAIAIYDIGKVEQTKNISISGKAKLVANGKDREAYQVLSLADIGVTNPDKGYGVYVGDTKTEISGGFFNTAVKADYCAADYLPAQSNEYADAPYTVAKKTDKAEASVIVGGNAVAKDEESVKETTEAAQKEADKLLEEVKKEDPTVVAVDLEVSANVKDETEVAEDAKKIEEELIEGETVTKYLDVSVALKTTTVKDDVTKVEKKELDETSTEIPITFPVEELGSKIVRIAHVHDGEVEFMDYVADYENGLVTVYMNKFSTLAVITSDTAIVAFETNGGSEIDPVEVNFGEKLAKPADPTKDGYIFAGWYTDEELTEAYDFDQEVTEDMYLYAKWTKKDDSKNPTKDPIKDSGKDNGKNNGKDGQKTQPAKNTDKKAQTVAAKTAAKTGDTSNVWMAAIVMLLAAGATGVVVVYRKKQR